MADALLHHTFDPNHWFGALTVGALFLAGAIVAAKLLRRWARRMAGHPQALIDPTAASFITPLLQVACFLIAGIVYAHLVPSLQRLGEAMLASAGVVSLVIGLAAQNTLGNLIAGLSLLMYRPFAVGDVLTLNTPTGKETGTVKEITLGHTNLITDDGRWIIVPNSVMASNIVIRVK
jgi:small-conductance mechanosensitive channel